MQFSCQTLKREDLFNKFLYLLHLDSASESICEHTPGTTIRCPTGYNINVRYANYGRLTTASSVGCPTGPQSINCRTSGSLQIVQNLCNGKQYCTLTASNSIFGDPCHGVRKVLDVTYECKIGPCKFLIIVSHKCFCLYQ